MVSIPLLWLVQVVPKKCSSSSLKHEDTGALSLGYPVCVSRCQAFKKRRNVLCPMSHVSFPMSIVQWQMSNLLDHFIPLRTSSTQAWLWSSSYLWSIWNIVFNDCLPFRLQCNDSSLILLQPTVQQWCQCVPTFHSLFNF